MALPPPWSLPRLPRTQSLPAQWRYALPYLVHRAAGIRGDRRFEQLLYIHGVEYVGAIAKIAMHFHLAAFRDHAAGFLFSQALQHPSHPLARASATKKNRRRFEQAQIVLVEQPMQ